MHSVFKVCGNSVQKPYRGRGLVLDTHFGLQARVQNKLFIHGFMNTFSTRLCTSFYTVSICLVALVHPFHTAYNNDYFLNETNLL